MTGPILGKRDVQSLHKMLERAAGKGWDGILGDLMPVAVRGEYEPDDKVAVRLARMCANPEDREVIEWLLDITLRGPDHDCGKTIEETALNSARRHGRVGVGEVLLHAIQRGNKLIEEKQNG